MGTVTGFGVGGQNTRPLARGRLLSHEKAVKWHYIKDYAPAEETNNYFVPSFAILRHIYREDERHWEDVGNKIGRTLGRKYVISSPEDIVIKSIEQKALIKKIKEAGERPTAIDMRNIVFNIRDDLLRELKSAPSPLEIGLGRLAIFGQNHNKLGFTIAGWKGWRSNRGEQYDGNDMTSLDALMKENKVAMGNIAMAFPEMQFATSELSSSPHITIARKLGGEIKGYELRNAQSSIDSSGLDNYALFGDPVISYKLAPDEGSRILGIGHCWESLVEILDHSHDYQPKSSEVISGVA